MKAQLVAFAVVAGLAASMAPAAAQVRLTGAGGVTYPLGDLADLFDRGWHAQASASLALPIVPVGLRIDAAYNRFENGDEDFQSISGTINAIVNVPSVLVVPYLIGGADAYNTRISDILLDGILGETTNFGANVGAGVRITVPGVAIFAEARLHNIFTDGAQLRYIPLTVGIHF